MSRKTRFVAAALLLFVLVVSAYDSYRCVVDLEDLSGPASTEKNPIALWLIEAGGVELLVGTKTFGTGVVSGVVSLMIYSGWAKVWFVIVALVVAQTVVLSHYVYGMYP